MNMAIEAHFHSYFRQVNQNMSALHSDAYANTKYNNNQPVEFHQQRDEVDRFLISQVRN